MEKNPITKMTKTELQSYIISEAMKMLNAGDALEIEMNQNDTELGSDKKPGTAIVSTFGDKKSDAPAKAENIEMTEEPTEVKMNHNDKEGGSDEKIATAVKVDAASSIKKGGSVEGMHNADFESKDKNPSVKSSQPFEDRKEKVDMNEMDKTDENTGARTYVEAGAEKGSGAGASTGQHTAKFSETAKNEKEKIEAIAKGIQLPESFKGKKDLIDFINEEGKKLSKLI